MTILNGWGITDDVDGTIGSLREFFTMMSACKVGIMLGVSMFLVAPAIADLQSHDRRQRLDAPLNVQGPLDERAAGRSTTEDLLTTDDAAWGDTDPSPGSRIDWQDPVASDHPSPDTALVLMPEPSTLIMLLAIGAMGLLAFTRRLWNRTA